MKSKNLVIGIIVVIVVAGGYFLLGGQGQKETGPIQLGFVGPLTGDAATIGLNAQTAMQLAIDEINAAGGVNGRQLKGIYEDGKCTGKDAANAAQKLINVDGVPVIIGGACSAETSAFTGIANDAGRVVLSYCSSAPTLSGVSPYFFRDYPSDAFAGIFAARYMKDTLGVNNAAVLYTVDDWGVGLQDSFVTEFEKLGGTITTKESFERTSRDLRTQLTKVKASNPEGIFFLGFPEASIPGIKQMKELGLNVPTVGGDTWGDPTIWEDVGTLGDGLEYIEITTPLSDEFKAKMNELAGGITLCGPQAYDATYVIAQVIEKVGTNPDDIRAELHNVEYTDGVSSDVIKFEDNGDLATANYAVRRIENGAIAPLE